MTTGIDLATSASTGVTRITAQSKGIGKVKRVDDGVYEVTLGNVIALDLEAAGDFSFGRLYDVVDLTVEPTWWERLLGRKSKTYRGTLMAKYVSPVGPYLFSVELRIDSRSFQLSF